MKDLLQKILSFLNCYCSIAFGTVETVKKMKNVLKPSSLPLLSVKNASSAKETNGSYHESKKRTIF